MSTLFYERNPFDILIRNFFQDASKYSPLADSKVPHPADIYTTETHLVFDIACTGLAKEELDIQIKDNTLQIIYDKPPTEESGIDYIHRGIAKRSFNLGWKIDSKFDLKKAEAEFNYGMLKITIPFAKTVLSKTLQIK